MTTYILTLPIPYLMLQYQNYSLAFVYSMIYSFIPSFNFDFKVDVVLLAN